MNFKLFVAIFFGFQVISINTVFADNFSNLPPIPKDLEIHTFRPHNRFEIGLDIGNQFFDTGNTEQIINQSANDLAQTLINNNWTNVSANHDLNYNYFTEGIHFQYNFLNGFRLGGGFRYYNLGHSHIEVTGNGTSNDDIYVTDNQYDNAQDFHILLGYKQKIFKATFAAIDIENGIGIANWQENLEVNGYNGNYFESHINDTATGYGLEAAIHFTIESYFFSPAFDYTNHHIKSKFSVGYLLYNVSEFDYTTVNDTINSYPPSISSPVLENDGTNMGLNLKGINLEYSIALLF